MKAIAPTLALALILGGATARADSRAGEIDELLQRAERFLSRQVRHEREAIPLFMRAERLARAAGDRPRVARSLAGLGSAQLSTHRYAESESTLLSARHLARSIDLYEVEARVVRLLATLFGERGDFARALMLNTELLELATRHDDIVWIASAHSSLAGTLRRQGNLLRATQEAARAIAILDGDPRARDTRLLFTAPYLRGRTLLELGEYPEALRYLQRALAAAESDSSIAGRWHCLNDIGLWYQAQGDWQRAASYYRRALEIARIPDSQDMIGITLRGMAEVEAGRGRLGEAERLYEDALRVFTSNGIAGEAVHTLIGLAATRIDRGRLEDARPLLTAAIEEAARNQQSLALARGRFQLARLYLLQKRFTEAEAEYAATLELTQYLGYVSLRPDVLDGLAAAARGQGDLRRAEALYHEGAAAIEKLRSRIPALEQRASFAATSHRTYEGLAGTCLEQYQSTGDQRALEAAFAALERERSQNARFRLISVPSNPHRRRLEAAASDIHLQLASEQTSRERRVALLDRLDDVERQLLAIDGGPVRSGGDAVPPVSALRGVLRPEEMFVSIAQMSADAYAFIVTRERLRLVRLGRLDRLDERAEFFTELLASNAPEESIAAGSRIAHEVVAPWIAFAKPRTRRILVSTTGAVARIPFGALPDPARPSHPLLARFEIVNTASLTALATTRRGAAGRRTGGRALAIIAGSEGPRRVAIGGESWELPVLRSSAIELRALQRASHVERSEKPLRNARLRDYDVLHFSAHAFLDPRIASRSAIVVRTPQGDDDGLLQTREISALDLGGAAVVLASCQTAAGPSSPAEGLYSLARAFSAAGASAVVATLWSVHDRASALLFSHFYRYLGRGATMAAALRAAQMDTFGERPYANAQEWAAFTVIGDGAVVPLRSRSFEPLVGLASLLLVGVLLFGREAR